MRRFLLPLHVILLSLALTSCDSGDGDKAHGVSTESVLQPIVGGQLETGYPAVGVVFNNGWGGGSMCTGTLITPKVVLTAAHCTGYGTPNAFFVGNDMSGYGQVYDVTNFITHPNFGTVTENYAQIQHHDIAVAILKNSAATTPMPHFSQSLSGYEGSSVKFVGFGVTSGTASNSGKKRSVSGTIGEVWSQGWWNFTNPNNPKNTCQGDSGGPGFMTVNGVETVIGVVSSGDAYCVESGYNTRTDTNATWIAQMINTYDPGGVTQECGNGVCEVGESAQSCPEDCDVGSVCGDGVCDQGETAANCPQDCGGGGGCGGITYEGCCDGDTLKYCEDGQLNEGPCNPGTCGWDSGGQFYNCGTSGGADPSGAHPKACDGSTGPVCGDGACDAGETAASCPADCGGAGPVCGDGTCDAGETATSCPADCGGVGPICGDGTCDAGETEASCPADCGTGGPTCGDGTCDAGETAATCPGDCGGGEGPFCDGGITEVGCCEGQTLVFCTADGLRVQDCTANVSCGWNAASSNYSCGTAGTADPSGLHPYFCTDIEAPACGDGTCTPDEDCETCPADCGECNVGGEDVVDGDTFGGLIEDIFTGNGGGCATGSDSEASPWALLLLLLGMFVGTRIRVRA